MVSKPSQLRPPLLVVVGSYKLDKLLKYLDVLEMSKDIVYNKVETWIHRHGHATAITQQESLAGLKHKTAGLST